MSFNTILRTVKENPSLTGYDLVALLLQKEGFSQPVTVEDNTVDYYTFDGGLIQVMHENFAYVTGLPRYYSDPTDFDSYVELHASRNVHHIKEVDDRLEEAFLADAAERILMV